MSHTRRSSCSKSPQVKGLPQLNPHAAGSLSVGATLQERAKHDRALVRGAIPEGEGEPIREAIQRGQFTCHDCVIEEVARKLGRRVERRGRGCLRKDEGK